MEDFGVIGVIIGSFVGVMGAVIGSCIALGKIESSTERKFVFKGLTIYVVTLCLFLVGIFHLPEPFNYALWLPYGIFLPLSITHFNRVQGQIRAEHVKNRKFRRFARQKEGFK